MTTSFHWRGSGKSAEKENSFQMHQFAPKETCTPVYPRMRQREATTRTCTFDQSIWVNWQSGNSSSLAKSSFYRGSHCSGKINEQDMFLSDRCWLVTHAANLAARSETCRFDWQQKCKQAPHDDRLNSWLFQHSFSEFIVLTDAVTTPPPHNDIRECTFMCKTQCRIPDVSQRCSCMHEPGGRLLHRC